MYFGPRKGRFWSRRDLVIINSRKANERIQITRHTPLFYMASEDILWGVKDLSELLKNGRDQPIGLPKSPVSAWISAATPTLLWEGWLNKEQHLLGIGGFTKPGCRKRWFELLEVPFCSQKHYKGSRLT